MLKTLREQKPVGTVAVQFSGGEPTLSPLFVDAVSMARDLGFKQVQVATNGIRVANEPGFAQACRDAGLHTLYLQFDGLDDEIYRKVRGVPLLKVKQKAIQAARETHSPAADLAAGKPDKP
ncbi:radical SAM domain-containing protein, partial [mine drainage metagenome]